MKTHYHFLALRQGLATAINEAASDERVELTATLNVARGIKGKGRSDDEIEHVSRTIQLYGPTDIIAFDESMIIRKDPLPDSGNFEPNYFPAVEFAEPDFPWRYSPEPARDGGKGGSSEPPEAVALTPWITLIVLIAEDRGDNIEREFKELPRGQEQMPSIQVFKQGNLPILHYAWRWAQTQVTSEKEDLSKENIHVLMTSHPERIISRLLCTRRLQAKTLYRAFIVPTYKLGVEAMLGRRQTIGDESGPTGTTLAWDSSANQESVSIDLPYYHAWEFRTSLRGDFEHLVRLLEARALEGLGTRPLDCERPGFGLTVKDAAGAEGHTLEMEGAPAKSKAQIHALGRR